MQMARGPSRTRLGFVVARRGFPGLPREFLGQGHRFLFRLQNFLLRALMSWVLLHAEGREVR